MNQMTTGNNNDWYIAFDQGYKRRRQGRYDSVDTVAYGSNEEMTLSLTKKEISSSRLHSSPVKVQIEFPNL